MHKNNSFGNNSKSNIAPLDPKSYSGINNISLESEPNINSEINKISISNKSNISNGGLNISAKFESESDIFPKSHMQQYKNDLIPLKSNEENKIFSEKYNLNAYEGKNSGSESKLDNIEQLNKKEDSLISSEKISNKSNEKPGKNMNNLINDLSSKNINISNNSNINNVISIQNGKKEILNSEEEINYSFIGKKREFSEENHKNKFSIFTPPEKKDELKRFINLLNIEENQNNNRIRRKCNIDVLLKKIKLTFLKQLTKRANKILKSADCKKLFKYLLKSFVCNLQKKINKKILNVTFKDLFSINLVEFMENRNTTSLDIINYEHNKAVLEYLEKNNLKFDFLNKTYIELFNEYLESKEFITEIGDLKKREGDIYIKKYIEKAQNFINYFL